MKLNLITDNDETIIWAHVNNKATIMGSISIFGILPFFFLLAMPYLPILVIAVLNLVADIIKQRSGVLRWVDLLRRVRPFFNAGYWYVTTRNRVNRAHRATTHFPDDPIV